MGRHSRTAGEGATNLGSLEKNRRRAQGGAFFNNGPAPNSILLRKPGTRSKFRERKEHSREHHGQQERRGRRKHQGISTHVLKEGKKERKAGKEGKAKGGGLQTGGKKVYPKTLGGGVGEEKLAKKSKKGGSKTIP